MEKYVVSVGIITMLVLSGISVFGHTAEEPYMTDLIAGQYYDVGNVSVWNDGSNLYVMYNTTSGWNLAETHLHVADSLVKIPIFPVNTIISTTITIKAIAAIITTFKEIPWPFFIIIIHLLFILLITKSVYINFSLTSA